MYLVSGPAAVFYGAMVFGMADGSAKRVPPHLKREPYQSDVDPWAVYGPDGRPNSYFFDKHGYVAHFHPNRQPKK